ncbi:MAG TPA: hypothetical protein VFK13_04800 [Gemmatimonadaceae bacterium]|nr:hypothetical protein [Gemmatimonadaceae bacterium]
MRFTVTYAGPAVESGRMNAQTLGAAMLSMAQLVETSAAVTFGATAVVEVDVIADFRQGSFSYDVVAAAHDLGQQLIGTLDLKDLFILLGISGSGGLFGLYRWLRKRPVKAIEHAGRNETRITTVDGDSITVNAKTAQLYQNSTIHVHVHGVVQPLEREGIDEFRTGVGGVPSQVVRRGELEYFEAPPPGDEVLQDKITDEIVQLAVVALIGETKWQFRLPDGTKFRSTVDPEFMKQVARREVEFGAGDALEVKLHTVVTRDSDGVLRATREITRVVRTIPAPKQLDMGLRPNEGL